MIFSSSSFASALQPFYPLVLCWCTQSVNHACQPRGCRRAAHQPGCTRQHSWASAAVSGACKLMEHGSAQACPPVAMCRRAAWGGGGQGPPSAAPEEAPVLSLVLDAGKAMQNPSNLWAPRGCIGSRTVLKARTGRRSCPVDRQYCYYRCERPDRSLTSVRPLSWGPSPAATCSNPCAFPQRLGACIPEILRVPASR